MEPPIVQARRRDFLCICEDICMPYDKAMLLSNCYINRLTLQSVYDVNIEESLNGITKLLKLYGKETTIVHECLSGADKDNG